MTFVPESIVVVGSAQARAARSFGLRAACEARCERSGVRLPVLVRDLLDELDAVATGVVDLEILGYVRADVRADVRGATVRRGGRTLVSEEVETAVAAAALNRTERTIIRYVHDERLVGRKVHPGADKSKWLIAKASLDSLVAERAASSQTKGRS